MQININKENLDKCGVYKIINIINGNFYIGSTRRKFKSRISQYNNVVKQLLLKNKSIKSTIILNAFLKHGYDNFVIEIIELVENPMDILIREEYYINSLDAVYNICKFPTKGGSPNLNRKLSQEWKDKICEKSKTYKHSIETLEKVTRNNKNNSSIYKILLKEEEFTGNVTECSNYLKVDKYTFYNYFNKKFRKKDILIEKIKCQKKGIIVKFEEEEKQFYSYNECDRYLNMWRGYTSTKILRGELLKDIYEYKIIEDIV